MRFIPCRQKTSCFIMPVNYSATPPQNRNKEIFRSCLHNKHILIYLKAKLLYGWPNWFSINSFSSPKQYLNSFCKDTLVPGWLWIPGWESLGTPLARRSPAWLVSSVFRDTALMFAHQYTSFQTELQWSDESGSTGREAGVVPPREAAQPTSLPGSRGCLVGRGSACP